MNLFRNLQLRWLNYMLSKKISKKSIQHSSISFEKTKRIGILYDITKMSDSVFVDNYVQLLKKSGKKVELLAYKEVVEEGEELKVEYFTKKDSTWYGLPIGEVVNNFIETPFDILMALHINPVPQLEYIAALSHASFRVGCYDDDDSKVECYDLMIDNANNKSLQHFIQQIDKHLKIMN
jgi:hypothetical protein